MCVKTSQISNLESALQSHSAGVFQQPMSMLQNHEMGETGCDISASNESSLLGWLQCVYQP